jgi:hypothetical protein
MIIPLLSTVFSMPLRLQLRTSLYCLLLLTTTERIAGLSHIESVEDVDRLSVSEIKKWN